jgi:signal transduction protein with GAF and PtsI domain
VVDTFIQVLPGIVDHAPGSAVPNAAFTQISQSAAATAGPTAPVEPATDAVLDHCADIVKLANVVNASSSFADALDLAAMTVRRIVGRGTCAIYVATEDGRTLSLECASGPLAPVLGGISMPLGQKLTGWVGANRRSIVNSDAQLDLCDVTGDIGAYTCLSAPLCDGESLAGVLTIYREAARPFSAADSRALEMLAPHLARMVRLLRDARAPRGRAVEDAGTRTLRVITGSR